MVKGKVNWVGDGERFHIFMGRLVAEFAKWGYELRGDEAKASCEYGLYDKLVDRYRFCEIKLDYRQNYQSGYTAIIKFGSYLIRANGWIAFDKADVDKVVVKAVKIADAAKKEHVARQQLANAKAKLANQLATALTGVAKADGVEVNVVGHQGLVKVTYGYGKMVEFSCYTGVDSTTANVRISISGDVDFVDAVNVATNCLHIAGMVKR